MDAYPPASDQILVFLSVVDHGSFSAAARHLERAQSAITYAVHKLESDLGVALFDRSGRRPVLTPAGEALVANARRIAHELAAIQRRARGLLQGLESELGLVVDPQFPMARLFAIIKDFAEVFPTVPIRMFVEALGAAAELVLDRTCVLGIAGPVVTRIDGLSHLHIGTIERVLVAAPSHPVARWKGEITPEILGDYAQVVLTDRSELTHGQDFGVLSPMTWRLSDLGAKHDMILAGLGWGGLPRHMVESDLREKRLVELRPVASVSSLWSTDLAVFAVHRTDTALGPAARWTLDRLKAATTD
jgi:DNA-binding transcriptional LysR family regulator